MGVSGQAGNIKGKLIPGGNPFEAPSSRGYPLPPLRPSGWTDCMKAAAKRLGLHPLPGPAAIRSGRLRNGVPGCQYCGYCTYNGCMVEAWARHASTRSRGRRDRQPEDRAGARATKIEVDAEGRASGVTYSRAGENTFSPPTSSSSQRTFTRTRDCCCYRPQRRIRTACRTISGQVGKHYISHMYARTTGLSREALNRFSGPERNEFGRRLERRQLRP